MKGVAGGWGGSAPKKKGPCPVTDTTAVTWGVPLGLEAPASARRAGNGKARALESAVGRVTRGSWGGRVGAIAAGKPGQAEVRSPGLPLRCGLPRLTTAPPATSAN